MTVASNWDDTTWQTHLDGYLSILSQSRQQPTGKAQDSMLAQALECAGDDATVQQFHSSGTMADIDKVTLLLDISKLRLRTLARKLCMLLQGVTPPRKLDVQKLQSSVKQVYADLQLGTFAESPRKTVIAHRTNIDIAAVRVIAASILIQCGQFLHPTGLFNTTRQNTKLNSSIRTAMYQIRATTDAMCLSAMFPDTVDADHRPTRGSVTTTVMDALSVIWPLFVVGTIANTAGTHRTWAHNLLLTLGNKARIPKALHLVSPCRRISQLSV
jgi:hypothetical protein